MATWRYLTSPLSKSGHAPNYMARDDRQRAPSRARSKASLCPPISQLMNDTGSLETLQRVGRGRRPITQNVFANPQSRDLSSPVPSLHINRPPLVPRPRPGLSIYYIQCRNTIQAIVQAFSPVPRSRAILGTELCPLLQV
jgi:hypothetical protein